MSSVEVIGASSSEVSFVQERVLREIIMPFHIAATGASAFQFTDAGIVAEAQRIAHVRTREFATAFAERALRRAGVAEVWLDNDTLPATVSVVLARAELDLELELRALFAEYIGAHPAELNVYSESEGLAENARVGVRLLA